MTNELPKEVREFIGRHIHSLAQLEVLLMLRTEADRAWRAEEITSALYLSPQMVADLLGDLVNREFVVQRDDVFYYQPANVLDRSAIDRLAEVFRDRRVALTTEIFSKPVNFVKAFADAFRLRKEK